MKHINNVQKEICGGNTFRTLEQDYTEKVKGIENQFLQFNATAVDPNVNKLERIIGFGNLELMPLLNRKI